MKVRPEHWAVPASSNSTLLRYRSRTPQDPQWSAYTWCHTAPGTQALSVHSFLQLLLLHVAPLQPSKQGTEVIGENDCSYRFYNDRCKGRTRTGRRAPVFANDTNRCCASGKTKNSQAWSLTLNVLLAQVVLHDSIPSCVSVPGVRTHGSTCIYDKPWQHTFQWGTTRRRGKIPSYGSTLGRRQLSAVCAVFHVAFTLLSRQQTRSQAVLVSIRSTLVVTLC